MKQRRSSEPSIEKISKHELAATVSHVLGLLMKIEAISASGEIDRLCKDGMSKLYNLSGAAEIQKQLDEIRARQLDPTM